MSKRDEARLKCPWCDYPLHEPDAHGMFWETATWSGEPPVSCPNCTAESVVMVDDTIAYARLVTDGEPGMCWEEIDEQA